MVNKLKLKHIISISTITCLLIISIVLSVTSSLLVHNNPNETKSHKITLKKNINNKSETLTKEQQCSAERPKICNNLTKIKSSSDSQINKEEASSKPTYFSYQSNSYFVYWNGQINSDGDNAFSLNLTNVKTKTSKSLKLSINNTNSNNLLITYVYKIWVAFDNIYILINANEEKTPSKQNTKLFYCSLNNLISETNSLGLNQVQIKMSDKDNDSLSARFPPKTDIRFIKTMNTNTNKAVYFIAINPFGTPKSLSITKNPEYLCKSSDATTFTLINNEGIDDTSYFNHSFAFENGDEVRLYNAELKQVNSNNNLTYNIQLSTYLYQDNTLSKPKIISLTIPAEIISKNFLQLANVNITYRHNLGIILSASLFNYIDQSKEYNFFWFVPDTNAANTINPLTGIYDKEISLVKKPIIKFYNNYAIISELTSDRQNEKGQSSLLPLLYKVDLKNGADPKPIQINNMPINNITGIYKAFGNKYYIYGINSNQDSVIYSTLDFNNFKEANIPADDKPQQASYFDNMGQDASGNYYLSTNLGQVFVSNDGVTFSLQRYKNVTREKNDKPTKFLSYLDSNQNKSAWNIWSLSYPFVNQITFSNFNGELYIMATNMATDRTPINSGYYWDLFTTNTHWNQIFDQTTKTIPFLFSNGEVIINGSNLPKGSTSYDLDFDSTYVATKSIKVNADAKLHYLKLNLTDSFENNISSQWSTSPSLSKTQSHTIWLPVVIAYYDNIKNISTSSGKIMNESNIVPLNLQYNNKSMTLPITSIYDTDQATVDLGAFIIDKSYYQTAVVNNWENNKQTLTINSSHTNFEASINNLATIKGSGIYLLTLYGLDQKEHQILLEISKNSTTSNNQKIVWFTKTTNIPAIIKASSGDVTYNQNITFTFSDFIYSTSNSSQQDNADSAIETLKTNYQNYIISEQQNAKAAMRGYENLSQTDVDYRISKSIQNWWAISFKKANWTTNLTQLNSYIKNKGYQIEIQQNIKLLNQETQKLLTFDINKAFTDAKVNPLLINKILKFGKKTAPTTKQQLSKFDGSQTFEQWLKTIYPKYEASLNPHNGNKNNNNNVLLLEIVIPAAGGVLIIAAVITTILLVKRRRMLKKRVISGYSVGKAKQ